jgi:glycosyltransferase involved in cell wall biosynthesis
MQVIYDYQIFCWQNYGGISRYYTKIIEELLNKKVDAHIISPIYQNQYLKLLPKNCIHGYKLNYFLPKTARIIKFLNNLLSPLLISQSKLSPDIIHETYFMSKSITCSAKARVVTVYDMIHEKFPNYFPRNDPTSSNKLKAIKRADHIICISNSTKNDLCNFFNVPLEKISVVYLACEDFNKPVNKNFFQNDRPFLLHVGGRGLYKNFIQTLKALSLSPKLKETFDIIAFGGGKFTTDEKNYIYQLGFSEKSIKQLSGNDELLNNLYNQASALVFPSFYEGFGLPLLEAMAHGCPVIASKVSSIPEVASNAAQYFDPSSVEDLQEAITKVMFDKNRRLELISNGYSRVKFFSWQRCATETLDVYKNVLNNKNIN